MTPQYEKLQKVLHEIFELDKADLDFGIYRIMNQKRKQVDEFLSKSLPKQIREILSETQTNDKAHLETELAQAIKSAEALGANPNDIPKITELRSRLSAATNVDALEQEVYSHLASFFKRYYKEGDFISMRRYKKDVYAIPYEGEEVKLYWANHDQYYIKTSEYLKNYAFKVSGDRMVRFQLKEATTEQNNNKTQGDQERRFAIYEELPVEADDEVLYINFTYEPYGKSVKQDDLTKKAFETIKTATPNTYADIFAPAPTEKNTNRTLIEKHLNDFISRNTFDYFIHKDLGAFLRRELDFYIKNEVLFIDDIDTENPIAFTAQLSKIKALKAVAGKIITFLAQIEDFQKKLWLKKKFVIRTDYCITLDRIPEKYYPEILACADQLTEWNNLFDVSVTTLDDLKIDPHLVLDTKFFKESFKDKLIAEFEDLDEQCDGLLINSENFQALNLITYKYSEKVQSLYIDPPYNTSASEIIYKNSYKHSSWLAMIFDRVYISKSLLRKEGMACVTIDDFEFTNLRESLDSIFGKDNFLATTPIRNNPSGRSTVKGFSINHEYGIYYSNDNDKAVLGRLPHSDSQQDRYDETDELTGKQFEWENFRKNGTDSDRIDRPRQYYPIVVNNNTFSIRIPEMLWNKDQFIWDLLEIMDKDETVLYPNHPNGQEKVWKFGKERVENNLSELSARLKNNQIEIYRKKYLNEEGSLPRTWWDNPLYSARDTGTRALTDIFGEGLKFSFPKSAYAVLDSLKVLNTQIQSVVIDFFAGSGTTGHAVIKLNREDSGNRKYLLVEMGVYFNTVTKPRIQKVIYSDNWRNGTPQDKEGISQMFKYQVLESYEDTLNNLTLAPTPDQANALLQSSHLQEEYLLKYMLDIESRDQLFNIEMFRDPFNYKLKITENNELVPTRVDLVETFNYLIGLKVKHIQRRHDIKLVEGVTRDGLRTLVIWRNLETTSEEDLDKILGKLYDSIRSNEFDQIYINGDHHLDNWKREESTYKVKLIEGTFFNKMFNISEL